MTSWRNREAARGKWAFLCHLPHLVCFSWTFRLADGCWRFTGGFFQGSLKSDSCAGQACVFHAQFTASNLGRGVWRTASPSRKDSTVGRQGLQQFFGGWWCRAGAGGNGSPGSGWGEGWGRAKHLLPLFPPVRLPCEGGLENKATLWPQRAKLMLRAEETTRLHQKPHILSFIPLLNGLLPMSLLGPSSFLGDVSCSQMDSTLDLQTHAHQLTYLGGRSPHQAPSRSIPTITKSLPGLVLLFYFSSC